MEKERCICSVLSLRKGESAKEMATILAKLLWERERQKVLFVPAGIQFERTGTVSLTELYFFHRKEQSLSQHLVGKGPIFVNSFHCFLESAEITDMQYKAFFEKLAEEVSCMVVSLDGVSSAQLFWFLEQSDVVAVLTECNKGIPSAEFSGFLYNLRLLWGEELGEQLKRFLFLLPGGGQSDKTGIQKRIREEGIFLEKEEEEMVFVTEEELAKQKLLFRRKAKGRDVL